MIVLAAALSVVFAVACLAWLWIAIVGLSSTRSVPRLIDLDLPDPGQWPTLSVVVPARNEVQTLEFTCRSLLEGDYPNLEILLVDDRSEDGTSALIDRLAAQDERIRPLHVGKLPEGWLGKNRALHVGSSQARGEWVLFTDATSRFARGALQQAIRWAFAEGRDHVTLLPDVSSGGFLVDAARAALVRTTFVMQRLWAVADGDSEAFAGIGAFHLMRREILERSGGLERVRLDAAVDLALGRLVKQSGARSGLAVGTGLLSVAGPRGLAALAVSLEKRVYPLLRCSPLRVLLASLGLLLLELAPWICLLRPGAPMLYLLGLVGSACLATLSARIAALTRRPLLPALVTPVGASLLVLLMLRAGVLGALLGGVRWRDAFYSSDALRRAATLTFPWWSLRRGWSLHRALLGAARSLPDTPA